MTPQPVTFPRHRSPAEIISHAVWLYHVFSLELILAERGVLSAIRPGDCWSPDGIATIFDIEP